MLPTSGLYHNTVEVTKCNLIAVQGDLKTEAANEQAEGCKNEQVEKYKRVQVISRGSGARKRKVLPFRRTGQVRYQSSFVAATIKSVCDHKQCKAYVTLSMASMLAPCSSSIFTAPTCPRMVAHISAVELS